MGPKAYEYFELDGTVALVTGASSGIGRHLSITLAAAGCKVGIAARRIDRLNELTEEIEASGGAALALEMDVTNIDSIAANLDQISQVFGAPSVLINNAGVAANHGFLEAPDDETKRVFEVNQTAPWNVSRAFVRGLIASKIPGTIVNIASIAGLRTAGGAAAYAVSKAAIAHMTRIQALELARHSIRVNAIAPGYFSTELNAEFLASDAGQKLVKRVPMRRTGSLEELEGLLLLLASNRSSFMTGAVIPIDGGHLVSSL